LSAGISVDFSHLPFRCVKKSSCTRTDGSMYSTAMPEPGALAAAFGAPPACARLAIRLSVSALNKYFFN
jgi:hypothetical protein